MIWGLLNRDTFSRFQRSVMDVQQQVWNEPAGQDAWWNEPTRARGTAVTEEP